MSVGYAGSGCKAGEKEKAMDKYCSFKKSGRFTCGQTAAAPHPVLANETLCREHLNDIKKYIAEVSRLRIPLLES